MSTVASFIAMLSQHGSDVVFHRDESLIPCPCLTPEGFRDPEWHAALEGSPLVEVLSRGAGGTAHTLNYLILVQADSQILSSTVGGDLGTVNTGFQIRVSTNWALLPANVDAFLIYRSEDDGEFRFIESLTRPAASYTDTAAINGPYPHGLIPLATAIPPVECNDRGFIENPASLTEISLKAFVQPAQSTRATRLTTEYMADMFGEIQKDDHLGIFPESWNGTVIDFFNWSQSGEDYIVYYNRKFIAVNANLIPDPSDGNPRHHWEVGLRLIG